LEKVFFNIINNHKKPTSLTVSLTLMWCNNG